MLVGPFQFKAVDARQLRINEQSDVGVIRGLVYSAHMFAEDMLIVTEGIDDVSLWARYDKKSKIGRKV
jgi:hypothetical protein